MRIFVRIAFRGREIELAPGEIIGRLESAALAIDEPSVSEAHAMVSLRRGRLWLLSLRRLLSVAGTPVSEVELETGMTVELAAGVEISIAKVNRPETVWAIQSAALGTRLLPQVASLLAGSPPRLVARFEPSAAAHIWWRGDGWQIRAVDGVTRSAEIGQELTVGGERFTIQSISAENLGLPSTHMDGAVESPLHIVSHYDTVELHRRGRPVLTLGGVGARIVSELVAFDGPVEWEIAAREVWPNTTSVGDLRHRWDVSLSRLRQKLRRAGVRSDLLRADGSGCLQLVLGRSDTVEDRS